MTGRDRPRSKAEHWDSHYIQHTIIYLYTLYTLLYTLYTLLYTLYTSSVYIPVYHYIRYSQYIQHIQCTSFSGSRPRTSLRSFSSSLHMCLMMWQMCMMMWHTIPLSWDHAQGPLWGASPARSSRWSRSCRRRSCQTSPNGSMCVRACVYMRAPSTHNRAREGEPACASTDEHIRVQPP